MSDDAGSDQADSADAETGPGAGPAAASDGAPEDPPEEPNAEGAETGSRESADGERPHAGTLLRGTPVAPGLVLGVVHRKDYDLARAAPQRVALDEVERELNRFRKSLGDSRRQLLDLKSRLEGRVQADDARILDTHVAYLKDSVFIADVENLILNEQMGLEAAIAKVINDFDRIFRLVQGDSLRQTAVDLRDVAIRVLRNLEMGEQGEQHEAPEEYVLVARELSIVDMFNLSNEHVQGIVTEEGGLTSHAAIFARSMRIPTITGVEGLLTTVHEGQFVILDATEGVVRVEPDDLVRQQYLQSGEGRGATDGGARDREHRQPRTRDGESIEVAAMCGNLPEVEQAATIGLASVGLYRTELLYLVDKEPPTREALVRHYRAVVEQAATGPVTFRLLNADSSLEIRYLHPARERNPQLGQTGVRVLLAREGVLRRQLQAILLAGASDPVRIAIPFVTDCGELRRVKEILFEERLELRKTGESFQDDVDLGVVIETPASLLGLRDLAREADFLTVNLDSLVQYLMAADRENSALSRLTASLHPYVLRAVSKLASVCSLQTRPLTVFGLSAIAPGNLRLLLGCGIQSFCIPPSALGDFLDELASIDLRAASRATRTAMRAASVEETQSVVRGYRHGYAQP